MSRTSAATGQPRPRRWRTIAINLTLAAGLLFTLSFLPPDNSLSSVQKSGILRACVPASAPPLVTTDPQKPGYDIELLGHIASALGVRLATNVNPAIGADFNVRNWRLNRAQCAVIAGGVIDDSSTRGFLQVLSTGAQNGWARLANTDTPLQRGDRVGVFPSPTTLDRLRLSQHLREAGVEVTPFSSLPAMLDALRTEKISSAITDYLTITSVDIPDSTALTWVFDPGQEQYSLAIGLWKGDATLFREVQKALLDLSNDGALAALAERYGLAAPPSD